MGTKRTGRVCAALVALLLAACSDSTQLGAKLGDSGLPDAFPDGAIDTDGSADASDGNVARPLWNGVDLSQWDGDPKVWSVIGDAIVANAAQGAITQNTFLIYRPKTFSNFALTADVRIGTGGNSGIQYRSTVRNAATWVVAGYQADIGPSYWGLLYDERGRGQLAATTPACLQSVNPADYNAVEVVADGPVLIHRVNGIQCVSYTEMTAGEPTSGVIALQYHMPGGFEVRFRNLMIREL